MNRYCPFGTAYPPSARVEPACAGISGMDWCSSIKISIREYKIVYRVSKLVKQIQNKELSRNLVEQIQNKLENRILVEQIQNKNSCSN